MQCDRCGGEKFYQMRKYPSKRYVGGKWIYSANIDTRKVYCAECGQIYYTETIKSHIIEFDKKRMKKKIKSLKIEQTGLFDDVVDGSRENILKTERKDNEN